MFIINVCLCEMVLRIHRSWVRRQKITWLIWDQGLQQWSAPGSVLLLRPACLPLWLRFALPHQSHSPPDWLVWVSLIPWIHNVFYILDIMWEALLFVCTNVRIPLLCRCRFWQCEWHFELFDYLSTPRWLWHVCPDQDWHHTWEEEVWNKSISCN